jgi:predicted DsbA family dithiol-disulfide isomerase
MKLYVFSDDDMRQEELNDLAMMLHIHKKRMARKKNLIQDEDIVDLALNLGLSVEKFEKIMKRKKKL